MDSVIMSNDFVECQTIAIKVTAKLIVHSRFVRQRFILVQTHTKCRHLCVK